MFKATTLISLLSVLVCSSPALGQECSEYFAPWEFVATIDPSGEVMVEYSLDCFHIPSESWRADSPWAGREFYTSADLVLSEMGWWEVGRLGWFPGAGRGRVMDDDGLPLRIESQLTKLENGRVLSTATIPNLVGLPAEPGEIISGPIQAHEELFMLWRLEVDRSVGLGNDYWALWSTSGRLSQEMSFNVVPEPTSSMAVLLTCFFMLSLRCRTSVFVRQHSKKP